MRVLFQGDSITDVGRNRDDFKDLGNGYPNIIAEHYQAAASNPPIEWLNRGISGHRVVDLQERWQEECIDLKPDILSILIGINDVWRRYDSNDPTSVQAFEAGYRDLLRRFRAVSKAKIILIEPFLLHVSEERRRWREDLNPKRLVVAKLAEEFDALYIPMDGVFEQATKTKAPAYWAADGVHPTQAGHRLIADTWNKMVEEVGYDQ